MAGATVTSKGQVTIPKAIRKFLGVEAGDQLDFVVEERSRVVIRAGNKDATSLKGLLSRRGRPPVTVEQMNAAILRRHGKR